MANDLKWLGGPSVGLSIGSKKKGGNENVDWYNNNLRGDAQWQKWEAQGRIPSGEHTSSDWMGAYAQLQAEDKRIAQYYELATGKKADASTIERFGQYANDPALLEAAITKESKNQTFDPGTTTDPITGETIATDNSKIADSVKATIKDKMGRDATDAELQYFGKLMSAGNLDAYTLNSFLENTNEYQTKASETARGKLATELQAADQPYLDKVGKQLESKYAAQGRPGAGAFGSALIQAGKDLATERQATLAGYGYQDFQRGQQALMGDYQSKLSNMYAQQQQASGLAQESRQRYYATQDYNRQAAAQERLARITGRQQQQGSFLQNLIPGVIGAGAQIASSYIGKPVTNRYY